jgi:hypothetical protein
MPYGVFWMCKRIYMNEMSTYEISGFNEQKSWLDLLNAYTGKKLTYPWDRLYALRGTINELQKTRSDKFRFDVGMWENEILDQILWLQIRIINEEDSLDFPTWNWVTTGGSKTWICMNPFLVYDSRLLPKSLDINDDDFLVATGHLSYMPLIFCRSSPNIVGHFRISNYESIFTGTFWGSNQHEAFRS